MILPQKFKPSAKMQKVIIDTNVIVSSLIQKGIPYHIIYDLFVGDKISLCISSPLLAEYYADKNCNTKRVLGKL